ncbi:MAG: VanW family protein [Clostridia bacterium]|nr:VanW family protein [Clostridia bacterium]
MKKTFKNIIKTFKNSKGIVWATVLCAVALAMIACFFTYSSVYSKIMPNVWAEGINIGNMSTKEAEEMISSSFQHLENNRSLLFVCEGSEKSVSFEELKLKLDSKTTAEKAFNIGRAGGILKKSAKLFGLAFKSEDIPLSVTFDQAALENIILELSGGHEVPPTETSFTLDGNELTIVRGHGGKVVDRKKAAEKIALAFSDPSVSQLELKLETREAQKVNADEFYNNLTSPTKDASYRMENGEVVIDPEKPEITVDKALVEEALASDKDVCVLTVETKQPSVTAKQLKELLFRDTLASYSSSFATSSASRASNVILTANRINGKILMPGEVFSYDAAIGKRTAANGYREANVYIGNKVESGIGGGICQTSSTLYSAVLYANLEIVSRTSHSLPVSYIPAGQDSTIAEGYIDLKFKNSTEYPVKILATVNGRKLTCSILGVKKPNITVELSHHQTATYTPTIERTENSAIPKGYKHIINKGAPGFAVSSQRIVKESGKVIKTENLTKSVYRAAPIEEEVNPADKNTPSEQLKIYTPGMQIPEESENNDAPTVNPEVPENTQSENQPPVPLDAETESQDASSEDMSDI